MNMDVDSTRSTSDLIIDHVRLFQVGSLLICVTCHCCGVLGDHLYMSPRVDVSRVVLECGKIDIETLFVSQKITGFLRKINFVFVYVYGLCVYRERWLFAIKSLRCVE